MNTRPHSLRARYVGTDIPGFLLKCKASRISLGESGCREGGQRHLCMCQDEYTINTSNVHLKSDLGRAAFQEHVCCSAYLRLGPCHPEGGNMTTILARCPWHQTYLAVRQLKATIRGSLCSPCRYISRVHTTVQMRGKGENHTRSAVWDSL